MCSNTPYVDPWVTKRLQRKETTGGERQEEEEEKDDSDDSDSDEGEKEGGDSNRGLGDAVNEGELFAVHAATPDGESFTLIMATSGLKVLDQDVTGWDGETYSKGEEVIEGYLMECADEDDKYRVDEEQVA